MTVQELIDLALADIGVTDPEASQREMALKHLNMLISNFSYWKPEDQPIERFSSLSEVIEIPSYYLEVFEIMLAAREAITYGLPVKNVELLETKSTKLTNKLIYRRSQGNTMNASGIII